MIDVDAIGELRMKYRGRLDDLPPAEIVVPSSSVARKSQYLAIELEDHVPREVAFQLIREAIDDAFRVGYDEHR